MDTNQSAFNALRQHWPEYLMEAAGLGMFMISACFFTVLLEHPSSPVRQAIESGLLRRLFTGMAMGLTAIGIIHTPWGKQSGAHLNPSFTWSFFRLGKIQKWDAAFYSIFQFAGGITGVLISATILRMSLSHPAVQYAVTIPGTDGPWIALIAEVGISFLMMLTVLTVSNNPRYTRLTPFFAGTLIATYITLEAPLSGMSMNPARTLGSAFSAHVWTSIWIYFVAPTLGMLAAAEIFVRAKGLGHVFCAKLNHHNNKRCIFRCNYGELLKEQAPFVLSSCGQDARAT